MRVLTGLQPSGKLHLGNYFASIKQMVDMQEQNEMFMFIANYHAMTSLSDGKALKQNTFDAACAFLALGIDPDKSIFWVQSDVKDVLELYWSARTATKTRSQRALARTTGSLAIRF